MSHTTHLDERTWLIHNSDWSGPVTVGQNTEQIGPIELVLPHWPHVEQLDLARRLAEMLSMLEHVPVYASDLRPAGPPFDVVEECPECDTRNTYGHAAGCSIASLLAEAAVLLPDEGA